MNFDLSRLESASAARQGHGLGKSPQVTLRLILYVLVLNRFMQHQHFPIKTWLEISSFVVSCFWKCNSRVVWKIMSSWSQISDFATLHWSRCFFASQWCRKNVWTFYKWCNIPKCNICHKPANVLCTDSLRQQVKLELLQMDPNASASSFTHRILNSIRKSLSAALQERVFTDLFPHRFFFPKHFSKHSLLFKWLRVAPITSFNAMSGHPE